MPIKRNTVQRQIVLHALKGLNTHPSIDEIYDEINKEHPAISKSTVYRNLRQLAESGIIRQLSLPDGPERYDGNNDRHYHFRCRDCDSVYDLDTPYIDGIDDRVQTGYGFRVDRHEIVFTGVCNKCSRRLNDAKI